MKNRETLIREVAERTGIEKYRVENILNGYENLIIEHLKNGEDIHLHGFVSFYNKKHSKKTYENPKTKERREIKPHKKLKVTVSDKLNRAVNGTMEGTTE